MPSDDPDDDGSLMPAPWLALPLAAIAALGVFQVATIPMNGDVAWYVYVGGRVLDGATPYVDLVDTNPPLIIGINAAIVAMARAVGLAPLVMFPLTIMTVIAGSLALSWRLGRGLPPALRQASLLAWAYLLTVQVGGMFGQREHLLMILILPYAVAAVAEARGDRPPKGLAIATGLLAGVGFALKPFCVPTVIAVEIYLASRRGLRAWLRPQALAMGSFFAAYALAIAVATPQYFEVARRFAPLYPHHDPFGPLLRESSWRLAIVASAMVLGGCLIRRWAVGWAEVFGLLASWLAVAVYLTGKGWLYHWFPAVAVASAMLCGVVARVASRWPAGWRRGWSAAMLALLLPSVAIPSLAEWRSYRGRDDEAARLADREGRRGESILVLSCWIQRAFPMINESGATWGMRHPMLWQVPAFYADDLWHAGHYHPIGAMPEAERRFVGEVAADFARSRPALLLVDDDPPRPSMRGFDYLAYFRLDPDFARALAGYDYAGRTPWFRVYRRRDAPRVASTGESDNRKGHE